VSIVLLYKTLRSEVMEVSGQLHAPVALLPGKERLANIRMVARWAPEPDSTMGRNESPTPVVQGVARRYTD
jgi:hypothetical protein